MSGEALKKLNSHRGYCKGILTRIYNFVSDESKLKESSLEALITQRDRLLAAFKDYETHNKEILFLDPEDSENVDQKEAQYFHCLTVLNELIKLKSSSGRDQERQELGDVRQSLAALKNLKAEVDKWDPLLMGVLTRKLDPYTARAFQMERDQDEEPTVVELLEYLDRKALSMENSSCNDKSAAFKLLPASKRISFANEKKLCSTCLNTHNGRCKFHFKCSQCQDKGHHTLLHPDEASKPVVLQSVANNDVLLPTARVKVYAKDGREVHIKCVLDSCSQSSLITSKAVDVLGFTPKPSNTKLIGVTESLSQVKYCISLEIHSLTSSYKRLVSFEVVDSITCNLPQNPIDLADFKFPDGIKLSDETFNKPSEINMLMIF
ncbi:putative peptidase (DUF1758) domain-containing protein [Phthorimaea operculella]|nr:putative peptidase (DUF1758) domain-containing protein [Phthorimaea operculella]